MQLPQPMPPRTQEGDAARTADPAARASAKRAGVAPAGCCLTVCDPITGCRCVFESPLC